MKRHILIFGLLILTIVLPAQDKLDINGYIESQMMGTKIPSALYSLNSNKLRVDLKSDISENISFAANFNFLTHHGKTQWNILEFLPAAAVSEVPEGYESFYILPFRDRHYLDNAYMKLSFSVFDLTVGKQQLSMGTGYIWNPTDLFNIKDYLDPTYEQPGHNGIRLDITAGKAMTVTLLYSPEETWKRSAKMIRIKSRISHFDVAATAIEKGWDYHDYTDFDANSMSFRSLPDRRRMVGGSIAGELLGIGLWGELGYNWMESSDDFAEWIAGGDYTFDFQTYIMAEYYHNSLGETSHQSYRLNNWMRLMASEQRAIARDQLYLLLNHPASDFITAGLSTVVCFSDGSMAVIPTINWSLSENLELMMYFNINFGEEGTMYSKESGNGGLVRIRLHF